MNSKILLILIYLLSSYYSYSQSEEKAKVILWPGMPFLKEHKMIKRVMSNGVATDIANYDSCKYDLKMSQVLSDLSATLNSRGYNSSTYANNLEELKKERANTFKALSEAGYSNINLEDDVSNYAQSDFNLFVSYTFIRSAGQLQASILIEIIEPGTARTVGSKSYTTDFSSASEEMLLSSLYTNLLFEIGNIMDKEIKDRETNGRYIIVSVLLDPNSSLRFNQLFDGSMLSAIIADLVFEAAQGGATGKQINGAKELKFDGARMKYRTPKGRPQTAVDFSALIAGMLADNFTADPVPTVMTNKAFLVIKSHNK